MALRNETREQTLTRLLAKARHDGIKLYRDHTDGRHYATSASDAGTPTWSRVMEGCPPI